MDPLQLQLTELNAEIARLTADNYRFRSEVCPDIQAITHDLLMAGLIAWGDSAIAAYNVSHPEGADSVTPLILKLHETAMESRTPTQCDRIKDLFGTICQMSAVIPTSTQATAMQAVLDKGSGYTGAVKNEYLNFKPWI